MSRERGPLPPALGKPLSRIFGVAVARRNARYDRGRNVHRSPLPIISVGNISVGGVGKTPLTQRIARTLLDAGQKPAILLRGYKAQRGETSDEEAEHRDALPELRVVADPDRVRAARTLADLPRVERPTCLILDDGFQHRRLARDLDIVAIDATRPPWSDALLPAGWLREPPSSLARADAVVVTHADRVDEASLQTLVGLIRRDHGRDPVALTAHSWRCVRVVEPSGAAREEPVEWLVERRVAAVCAIGAPARFTEALERAGAEVVSRHHLRDHAHLSSERLRRLAADARSRDAGLIVCTRKDWMKLKELDRSGVPVPIAYPVLSIEPLTGGEALDDLVLRAASSEASATG